MKKSGENGFKIFMAVTAMTAVMFCAAAGTLNKTASKAVQADADEDYFSLYKELYVEKFVNVPYRDDEGCIYITFDDGPSPYTEEILEILEKHDIKATFFLSPEDTENDARLINLICEKGHTIGIHTASHVYSSIYGSVEGYLEDFDTAFRRIYDITGQKCRFFRFPAGSVNAYNRAIRNDIIDEMSRRGFVYFDWNVDSRDAVGADKAQIKNNVLTGLKGTKRAVILFHDGMKTTVGVLEEIIEKLENEGREFRPIDEQVKPVQF